MAGSSYSSCSEAVSTPVVVRFHRGDPGIIDEFATEWRALCQEAEEDQPFYRPEWVRAHIRAFSPKAKVLLITVNSNDRLCLVLPLLEESGTFCKVPVRRLRAPVNMHCGRFDAVCRAGVEGEMALRGAWAFLRNSDLWDLLQLNYVPQDGPVSRLAALALADGFPAIAVSGRPNPYVPVPHDADCFQNVPPNSKLRSQLRQAYRRLAEKGPLRLHRAGPGDLDRFYQLEASGWKGKHGTAILCDNSKRQFFDEIARDAAAQGCFTLYMLEWNGQLMAAHFSLVLRGRCYSPKVAYDETFRQFAPGHLIVNEILRDCSASGVVVFDITGDDEKWKMKWTNQARCVNHHLVFAGPRGNLAYTLGFKLKPAIGRLFPRRRKVA